MAKNSLYDGDPIDYPAPSDVVSGQMVSFGYLLCVALGDIAAGKVGPACPYGVWELPKAGVSVTAGAQLNFDASAGRLTTGATTAAGDITKAGIAESAAAAGDATVRIKLTPGSGSLS